jgi:hypothetical protein
VVKPCDEGAGEESGHDAHGEHAAQHVTPIGNSRGAYSP